MSDNIHYRSLAVGTKAGYSLYSLGSVDSTLDKIYTCPTEEIFLIERLFESSLVAIVAQRAPRKLKVCADYINCCVCLNNVYMSVS